MGNKCRFAPPGVCLHGSQTQQADGHDHQQRTTRRTENHTQKTIGTGQPGHQHQLPDQIIDQATQNQGQHKQNGASRNDTNGWGGDVVDQQVRQRTTEQPGYQPGDDPGQQRQRFLDKAPGQADQSGDGNYSDYRPVNAG